MADGDAEPWLNDPIVQTADGNAPQWSSTPAPGLEGLLPKLKDGPAPPADDQPWLKDPIVQPAPQQQAPEEPEKPWTPTAAQTIPNPLRRGSAMPQDNSRDLQSAGGPTSRINYLLSQGYKAIGPDGEEIAKLDETPSTQDEGYTGGIDDQKNISPEEEFKNWRTEAGIKFLHPDGSEVKSYKELQYDPDWKNKLKYMNEVSPRAPIQPPSAPQGSGPWISNDSAAIAGGASAAPIQQQPQYDTQNVRGMSEADFMTKTPQGPAPSMTPEKMAAQLEAMPGGSNSAMRALYAGLAQTTGSGMSLVGRIMSSVDPASGKAVDQLNRDLGTAEQGAQLADKEKDASLPEWALQGGRRVVQGVSTAMVAGPAAIPAFGADAANKASTDADDHGLTGKDKVLYVGGEAAINMATGALLEKLGLNKLGGGDITAGTLKDAIKGFGATAATTTTQNLLAALNRKVAGLDDGKPINFGELVRNSMVDAVLFSGSHELNSRVGDALKEGPSPDHVQLAVENPDAAWKIASKDQPSRKDIKDAGITQRMDADQRAAFAEKLRNYFTQDQAQQVPGAPEAQGLPPRQNDSPIAGDKFNLQTANGLSGQPAIEGKSPFSAKELQDRLGDRVPSQPQENNQSARRAAVDEGMSREDPRLAQVRDLESDAGERATKQQVADKLGVSREDARDLIKQAYANEPLQDTSEMTREQLADEAGVDKPGALSRTTLERRVEAMRDSDAKDLQENTSRPDRPFSKPITQMSPEELKSEINQLRIERHTDKLTGLKNGLAYEESEKKPVQTFMDADGLKSTNDRFGHDAGNALLKAVADAAREAGLSTDVHRLQGDEHAMQHDTVKQAKIDQAKLQEVLKNKMFRVQDKDGTVYEAPLRMSFGIGPDIAKAEEATKGMKDEREQRGQRELRSDWEQRFKSDPNSLPRGFSRVASAGDEVSRNLRQTDRSVLARPDGAEVNPSRQPNRPDQPDSRGQQAASGSEPANTGARQAVQSDIARTVQPEQGDTAESQHGAASPPEGQPAATPPESLSRDQLEKLSYADLHKQLRDSFGEDGRMPRGTSREKLIQKYLELSGVQNMGAMMGAAAMSNDRGMIQALKDIPAYLKSLASGQSYPEASKLSQSVANAMHRHAASNTAAEKTAIDLGRKVHSNDPKLIEDLGSVIKNNRLLGEMDRFGAQGKMAQAQAVVDNTDIGPGKRWATEEDFKKYIQEPRIADAIKRYQQIMAPWMNDVYRTTAGLKETDPVPFHGRYFEAPVNLLSNEHAEAALGRAPGPSENLQNLRKNFNIFRKKATGAAQSGYTNNLQDVIENTVNSTYAKASRLKLYNEMVKQGVGVMVDPGQQPPKEIRGQPVAIERVSVPDPETRGMVEKNLAMPKAMQSEFRMATATDTRATANPFARFLNSIQMFGPFDAAAHVKNIFSSVDTAISGSTIKDMTVRAIPILRQLDTIRRIASAAFDIKGGKADAEVAELARANALRSESDVHGPAGAAIQAADTASRVAMLRMFKGAVAEGKLQGGDENLRDFVNKAVGDYNHRSNGIAEGFMKDAGISPFITAGKTMARQGAKSLIGSYGGAEATSAGMGARLRTQQFVRNIVIPGLIASAGTYLLTRKQARPGVPFGAMDTGKDDDKGNPIFIDLLPSIVRRGLGVTGVGAAIDGLVRGQDTGLMTDAAGRDIVNHNLHAFAGPAVGAASEALLGKRLGWGLPPMPAADRSKGESQFAKNVTTAASDLNPILGGAIKGLTGQTAEGQGRGEKLKNDLSKGTGDYLEKLAGLRSGKVPLSPGAELAQAIYYQRVGEKQYTDQQKQAHDARAQVARDVKSGMSKEAAIQKAVDTGLVTEKEALASAKSGAMGSESSLYGKMTAEELKHVMDRGLDATPEEKAEIKAQFDKHVGNLMKPLAAKIPVEVAKKEQWKANLDASIQRAQKLGLSKDDAQSAYLQTLKTVKSDDTRAADRQRFMLQLNARWKSQSAAIAATP